MEILGFDLSSQSVNRSIPRINCQNMNRIYIVINL